MYEGGAGVPVYDHEGPGDGCGYEWHVNPAQGRAENSQVVVVVIGYNMLCHNITYDNKLEEYGNIDEIFFYPKRFFI